MGNNEEFLQDWMKTWRKCDLLYAKMLNKLKLNINEYYVLVHLLRNGSAEPSFLAETIGVQRQYMTIMLNGFEKKGFIARTKHETDHRRCLISLTAQGKEFAQTVLSTCEAADKAVLDAFSKEEQQWLLTYTDKVFEHLSHHLL